MHFERNTKKNRRNGTKYHSYDTLSCREEQLWYPNKANPTLDANVYFKPITTVTTLPSCGITAV